MATIHPQRPVDPLPSGWEARLDPRTGRYYFINHTEHTTTWEDPRMRHPQIPQGSYAKYYLYGIGKSPAGSRKGYPNYFGTVHYSPPNTTSSSTTQGIYGTPILGTPRAPLRFKQEGISFQVDESLLLKLCLQFPTVEEGHIWQFLKKYHNRENVVISALMAEGHPRAQTHPTAHENMTPVLLQKHIEAPPPPPVDEAIVHKLHSYFPAVDLENIRNLLKKFDNQEHEVIASLVSGSWKPGHPKPMAPPSSPKMKLRYLKLVFPEADEAVLFDILYNCDNNAYEASTRLSSMGYKKRDTPIIRPNSSQYSKPNLDLSRPKLPDRPIIHGPPSAADKQLLTARIQEQFPAVSKTLVNMALESSNYMEERAKQFLKAMTPMDGTSRAITSGYNSENKAISSEGLATCTVNQGVEKPESEDQLKEGTSAQPQELEPVEVTVEETKEVEENVVPVPAPREKTSLLSRLRSKFKKDAIKVTITSSSYEDIQNISSYRIRPKGPDPSLRKGPCEDHLLKDYAPWIGPDPKNRKGPDSSNFRGPDPKNLSGCREGLAKGPKGSSREHRRGPLTDITHAAI